MNFKHHLEMIQFDVVKMVRYKVILGIPWLEKHNPDIDWVVQDIDFPRCRCDWDPKGKAALPAPYYFRQVWENQLEQGTRLGENAIAFSLLAKN